MKYFIGNVSIVAYTVYTLTQYFTTVWIDKDSLQNCRQTWKQIQLHSSLQQH